MTNTPAIKLIGFITALIGALLFSTKAILVKLAFAHTPVDALTLLTMRMVFSLPFYLLVALWAGSREGNKKLSKRQWLLTISLGLIGYYLSSLFDFLGLQYISAGLERLILFLYPTFSVLINAYFFKEQLKRNQVVALLLTYAGIGLAYVGELQFDHATTNFYWGSFLVFLCAVTYASYISGSGRVIPKVGASRFTAYAMLASTAGVFLHFTLAGSFTALQHGVTLWGYGLALALMATVVPSFLIAHALKKIGASNVAIISSIGPVSTIVQAHYFLGEKIFTEQVLGTALVLAGVLLLGKKAKK